ncbi:hypothetical protein Clacol_001896 [Clathrus columnatus]|uniref:Uncharacterized protein n=1 Tax=Clathrus columnatus TaxID=1419009 RepID=A0AAV5A3T9_9AGAM|nr:hypothetical protein Clacol_001896 [Clathrus columnatus]
MTYTTLRQDGQILYSIYSAEPSSYQTPQGIVHGIQWQLVEVTPVLPAKLPPADRDFFASWGPNGEKERQRMIENWQHDAKIARREEAARYAPAADQFYDRDRRDLEERERRGRRISSNPVYGNEYSQYPTAAPRARSRSYSRYDQADEELARAMGGVALDRDPYDTQRRERERRRSVSRGPASRGPSPSRLPDYTTTTTRPRKASMSYPTAAEYSSSNYGAYASPPSPIPRGSSPYMGQSSVLPGGPVYPPGHVLAGRPIPGLQPGDTMATVTSYRSSSPRPATLPNYRSTSPRPDVMYHSSSPRPEAMYRSPSPRPDAVSVYRSSSRAPSPLPRETSTNVPPSFSRSPSMAFPYTCK